MSGIRVDASGFESSIADIFNNFTRDVEVKAEKLLKKKSDELNKELKQRSLQFKKSGEYAKGWRAKKEGNLYTHYNGGKHATLSHILENGTIERSYKTKTGNIHRTGIVTAKPHIDPAYQKIRAELEQELQNI